MMAEMIGAVGIAVPIAYALGHAEIKWRLQVSKRLTALENERASISGELCAISDKLDNCATREEITFNYHSLVQLLDQVSKRLDDLRRPQ